MNRRGFTLIELLVVIAIIGLLSSIVLASIKDARNKAELRAMQQGFLSIANALELYRGSNGRYPSTSGSTAVTGIDMDTLVNSHLSSYIKTYPQIPTSIFSAPLVRYFESGATNGIIRYDYSCDDTNRYSNGYVVAINKNTGNAPSDVTSYFPQVYRRLVNTNTGQNLQNNTLIAGYYCAVVPIK